MDKLRDMAPWQIILAAAGIVLVFLVGGYFLVTSLTSTPPPEKTATSTVPSNLDSKKNQLVIKQLDSFNSPDNLPILSEPLRTPDPNSPSSVNPFEN